MADPIIGKVDFKSTADKVILTVDPDAGFVQIILKMTTGSEVMQITNTGSLSLMQEGARIDGSIATLMLGANGKNGLARLRDGNKNDVIVLNAGSGNIAAGGHGQHGDVILKNNLGKTTAALNGGSADLWLGGNLTNGDVVLLPAAATSFGDSGAGTIHLRASDAVVRIGGANQDGKLWLLNNTGQITVALDGKTGDIVLQNADCAEEFDVADSEPAEPGSIMVFDDEGRLRQSREAYDKRVAGVVSGAGDYRPGIILDRRRIDKPRAALTLLGKVCCKVDASHGPIQVGDLLTTSATPGHAMRAADPLKAFGAVIGKALRPHCDGVGMIPLLVAQH